MLHTNEMKGRVCVFLCMLWKFRNAVMMPLTYCLCHAAVVGLPGLAARPPHPAALSLPPSSARQGEKTRLKKSHESRHGQGDDLPVTIMGKTGFTWGTFSLLSNTNRVGS